MSSRFDLECGGHAAALHGERERRHGRRTPDVLALIVVLGISVTASAAPLRVCADPDNLPFSNSRGEGYENKIAQLVARDLNTTVTYYWMPQRRGFVRNTLNADKCDVIIGVPSSFDRAATTRPYYRSKYVFVTRRDRRLDIHSLDDPRLRTLRIGVQMIGDDYANSPPAHALAKRGIVRNVAGYLVYRGQQKIIEAVASGDVDVSAVWGPIAGYYAAKSRVPLTITPFQQQIDLPFLPFTYDISMAVRRGETALRDRLDDAIERRQAEIDAILHEYGVPSS